MRRNRHAERERLTATYNRAHGKTRRAVLVLHEEVCGQHIPYDDWATAEIAARRTMDDIRHRRQLLAFRCEFCDRWHVGGDAPRIRNRCLTGSPRGWAMPPRVLLSWSTEVVKGMKREVVMTLTERTL